jgi:outer membrane protein assembly factor BamA
VRDISFTGNTFVSAAVLKNRILGFFPLTYNPAMMEDDVQYLIKYYRGFGFHDVKVARELHYSADGKEVSVTFHIVEGVRYKLQDFPQAIGVKSIPAEALPSMNKVRPGTEFNQAKIDEDKARIRDWIGIGSGREVRVQEVPIFSPQTPGVVRVNYEVEERPPARVSQIITASSLSKDTVGDAVHRIEV